MEQQFKLGDEIMFTFHKRADKLRLDIRADYRYSNRKGIIGFSEQDVVIISNTLLERWRRTKTKKLLRTLFYFEELDWYDSNHERFRTPTFEMKRGKRKPTIDYIEHNNVPKEWGCVLSFDFALTKHITPIMETIDTFFDANLNETERKKIKKNFRELMAGDNYTSCFVIP